MGPGLVGLVRPTKLEFLGVVTPGQPVELVRIYVEKLARAVDDYVFLARHYGGMVRMEWNTARTCVLEESYVHHLFLYGTTSPKLWALPGSS